MDKKEIVEILKSITVKDTGEHYKDEAGFDRAEKIGEALSCAIDIIDGTTTPNDEDINNLAYEVVFSMIRALVSNEAHQMIVEYIKKVITDDTIGGKDNEGGISS